MIPARSARKRSILALLASLLVYAIPLPGPNAVPVLGSWIVGAFAGSGGNGALGLATAALALVAQALTFFVVRWSLGARWRWIALIAYVPALVVCVYVMTYLVIPRFVLIDRDTTPENLSWSIECTLPDASVQAVRWPANGYIGDADEVWVRVGPDGSSFGLLDRETCEVTTISPPPRGTMHAITYAANDSTLETTWDVATQQQLWWWRSSSAGSAAIELPPMPRVLDGVPILSDDGGWLVLVERPEPPPASPHLTLRRLDDGVTHTVPLDGIERGTFVAIGAELEMSFDERTLARGEILLCRDEAEFFSIDIDGQLTSPPFRLLGGAGALSFRRVQGGWAAWDAYAENRPYVIAWDTQAGRGTHVVPKGRGITSCDVDSDGRWIAYSTSPVYSLGGVHDDVIVISLADGREVFRDCLPAYARSDVAFLWEGRLAYTAWDGGTQSEVRIVSAP